jgi:hypothetical protein
MNQTKYFNFRVVQEVSFEKNKFIYYEIEKGTIFISMDRSSNSGSVHLLGLETGDYH